MMSHCYLGIKHLNLQAMQLRGPESFDFRPTPTSPLVDAGVVFPPYTDGTYSGQAPDVGAYENDGVQWTAGCQGVSSVYCFMGDEFASRDVSRLFLIVKMATDFAHNVAQILTN